MNSSAEQRLQDLGIDLPPAPKPLGAYVEAVQVGNLLFLSGTLPMEGGVPKFLGRIGAELSIEDGRARLAWPRSMRSRWRGSICGSLDKVHACRSSHGVARHDAGVSRSPQGGGCRLGVAGGSVRSGQDIDSHGRGVASLPAGACVVTEVILAVDDPT